MSVNKVIIIGYVGGDPELKATKTGTCVCKFAIATNDYVGKDEEKTNWHRCTAFGRIGETINQYVKKGSQVYVEGRIDYGSYVDRNDQERSTTEIIVSEFRFIGAKLVKTDTSKSDTQKPVEQYKGSSNGNDYTPF